MKPQRRHRIRIVGTGIGLCLLYVAPVLNGGNRAAAVNPTLSHGCPQTAGDGGQGSPQVENTRGGDGCVVIDDGTNVHTFTHTGGPQSWTVPAGVSRIAVYLIGAGGGGARPSAGDGGAGGFTSGTLGVVPGEVFDVIVGGGGVRQCASDVPARTPAEARHNVSYGGGASGNTGASLSYDCSWASGGGRSAMRVSGGLDDLATAGGGGGAGYLGAGGAGGGLVGGDGANCGGGGGTQSAGGATCASEPGVAGIKYAGGWAGYSATNDRANSEGGGGGGGWFGGGGAGDNGGGGGGSGHVGGLLGGRTLAGTGATRGQTLPVSTGVPSISGGANEGDVVTAAAGTWSTAGRVGRQWQASSDGGATWIDIPGETGTSLILVGAGRVRVVETIVTPFGTASAQSGSITIVTTTTSSTTSTTTTSSTTSTTTTSSTTSLTTTAPRSKAGVTAVSTTTVNTDGTPSTSSSTTSTTTTSSGPVTPTSAPPASPGGPGAPVQSNPFDVVDGAPRFLQLSVALSQGVPAAGSPLKSKSGGLLPGSTVTLEVHSEVRVIATGIADAAGSVEFDSVLPADLEPGDHMIVLRGTTPQGSEVVSTAGFTLDESGTVTSVVQASESLSGVPTRAQLARAAAAGVPLYDTTGNVATSAALAVSATIVAGVMAAGAVSGASSGKNQREKDPGAADRDEAAQGEIGGLEATGMGAVVAVKPGAGDRLPTWTLPWQEKHQRAVSSLHSLVASRSAALSRLIADGHWVRAVFGSAQAALWILMAVAGIMAGQTVDGVMAPSVVVVTLFVSVSMLDAFAGTAAWTGFAVTVVVRFGIDGVYDLRTLLGLGVLLMGVPLIANHARPLRRIVTDRLDKVDRVADYLMLPLLMSFATKGVYTALNGLSGLQMVSGDEATVFSRWVLAAVVLRMVVEDLVVRTHPRRMQESDLPATDGPPLTVDIATLVLKGGLFLLAAGSFFGLGWRTWLVIGFMTVVPFLKLFIDRFPNVPFIHRWFPKGVLRTVIMLWVGAWLAGLILGGDSSPEHTKEMAAFLLLPGMTIGVIDIIGREGGSWPDTLWKRLVGGCLWTFSFLVMFGFVTI